MKRYFILCLMSFLCLSVSAQQISDKVANNDNSNAKSVVSQEEQKDETEESKDYSAQPQQIQKEEPTSQTVQTNPQEDYKYGTSLEKAYDETDKTMQSYQSKDAAGQSVKEQTYPSPANKSVVQPVAQEQNKQIQNTSKNVQSSNNPTTRPAQQQAPKATNEQSSQKQETAAAQKPKTTATLKSNKAPKSESKSDKRAKHIRSKNNI